MCVSRFVAHGVGWKNHHSNRGFEKGLPKSRLAGDVGTVASNFSHPELDPTHIISEDSWIVVNKTKFPIGIAFIVLTRLDFFFLSFFWF